MVVILFQPPLIGCSVLRESVNFPLNGDDCVFIVGEQQSTSKEFQCSRIILSKVSPVFASMLEGSFIECKPGHLIHIPDVQPAAFNALLRYATEGTKPKIDPQQWSVGLEILYAFKKYLISESLEYELRSELWRTLYPNNVWTALRFAPRTGENDLVAAAWQILKMRTRELLLHYDMVNIESEILEAVLHEESLMCTEFQLFHACERWIRHRISIIDNSDATTGFALMQLFLPHVRILKMTQSEISRGPCDSPFISTSDKLALVKHYLDRESSHLPVDFCSLRESRQHHDYEFFQAFGTTSNDLNNIHQDEDSYSAFSMFRFDSYRNTCLVLPTQVADPEDKFDSKKYDENLSVILWRGSNGELVDIINFKGTVSYDSTIDINLKFYNIVSEETILHAKVIFHKSGYYPLYISSKKYVPFAFNGSNNTYSDQFMKQFSLPHLVFHYAFCVVSNLLEWSTSLFKSEKEIL
ncbi:hypothetical protein B566_EDAN015010 [Ephemera danica]|nr:hypothetical protein B566_EDAN015010 [Ephemera danica]